VFECRVCKRTFNSKKQYETHCEGRAHILKLQAEVAQTYEAANRRSLYCRVCKVSD
jgi:hypothetical protein